MTSYGKREIGVRPMAKSAFVQLLEAVHEIEGLERIRFTSPHPKGYGDDLVEAYGTLAEAVESAHLPVQSGSDRVLKLMHRGYTRERFLEIVEKLRRIKPSIGMTTDIIVGFPGETEDDFDETLSLCKRGAASTMPSCSNIRSAKILPRRRCPTRCRQSVIEERHARLLEGVNEIAALNYRTFLGQRVQILVEGPSRKNAARFAGRTRCNKIVVFEGAERHRGPVA